MSATPSWENWRPLLSMLQGLPLLPCGAGLEGKAPLDPTTGQGLANWQKAGYSPESIAAMNGVVVAVGTRCGPEAGGLLCLDLDGASAISWLQERGCDPAAVSTWKVARSTAPDRVKLFFRCPPWLLIQVGKRKLTTGKGEQIELFWTSGQVIILGRHKPSGGVYFWPVGCGPDALVELPESWAPAIQELLAGEAPAPLLPAAATPLPPRRWEDTDDLAKAEDALRHLDPSAGYDDWLRIGMALHAIDPSAGLALWDRWSRGGSNYKGIKDLEVHWRSFSPSGGVGPGTLFKLAKDAGWSPPRPHRSAPSSHRSAEPPAEPEPLPPPDDSDGAEAAALEDIARLQQQAQRSLALADVLPPSLAEALETRAASFPIDPLALLLPLLATTASVIGNRVEIRVKKGWDEPFVIWAANVSPASDMKSPAAAVFTKPLGRWQVALNRQQREKVEAWKRERRDEADLVGNDKAKLAAWEHEHPCPPPSRELLVVDATLEAVCRVTGRPLYTGLISYCDELTTWFGSHKRGKDAPDQRGNWLSLWGGGMLKVDRATSEPIFVASTAHSIFGNLTRSKFGEVLSADQQATAAGGGKDGDGMAARFLLLAVNNPPWTFNEIECDVTDLLETLLREQIDTRLLPRPEDGPAKLLTFEPAARRELATFCEWLDVERRTRSSNDRAQWLGKLRGYCVRLSGVIHALDQAVKGLDLLHPITVVAVERSRKLCRFLIGQYDLLHAEAGGGTANLPADVARLVSKGAKWRKEHGVAPVTMATMRNWSLPSRSASGRERAAWITDVCARWPELGTVEPGKQGSVLWMPADPARDPMANLEPGDPPWLGQLLLLRETVPVTAGGDLGACLALELQVRHQITVSGDEVMRALAEYDSRG